MRSAPIAVLTVLLLIAPTAMAAWGMPDAINDRMEIIESLYTQILFVGSLVFLFVFGWLVYNLVKFRPGGDGQATNEDHRGSVKAELVWTIIPLLIVGWVGVISFQGLSELEQEPEEPAAEIHMTGFQWFWQAEYENGAELSQKPADNGSLADAEPFYVPAGEPVTFNITSGDVIHSFFLPELGVKIDAIPGEFTHASVTIPEGEYLIQCAEMCGLKHAYMNAKIKAVPMEEYEAWLSENKPVETGLQTFDVNLTADGLEPSELTVASGAGLTLNVHNDLDSPQNLTIEGTDNSTGEIAPGESGLVNATLEPGEYTMSAGDASGTITAVEPETMTVTLTDFSIDPGSSTFETGTPYLIDVVNEGGTVHNLYIGTPQESGEPEDIIWESKDIQPGESTTLLVVPSEDQTGTYEWWCDIPGHYELGMNGEVTIQ